MRKPESQASQSSSFTYTTTRLIIAVVPLFNLQPRPKWGSLLPSSPLPPLSSPLRPASATSLRRLTFAPPKTAAVTLAAHPTATSAQLIKSETSSVLFTYAANLTDLNRTANAQEDVEALSLAPRHEAQGKAPPTDAYIDDILAKDTGWFSVYQEIHQKAI